MYLATLDPGTGTSTPVPVADKSRLKCGPSSAFLHFSASNIVLFRVGVLSQDFTHSSDERFKFNALLYKTYIIGDIFPGFCSEQVHRTAGNIFVLVLNFLLPNIFSLVAKH